MGYLECSAAIIFVITYHPVLLFAGKAHVLGLVIAVP
jgi:hypothetical protein